MPTGFVGAWPTYYLLQVVSCYLLLFSGCFFLLQVEDNSPADDFYHSALISCLQVEASAETPEVTFSVFEQFFRRLGRVLAPHVSWDELIHQRVGFSLWFINLIRVTSSLRADTLFLCLLCCACVASQFCRCVNKFDMWDVVLVALNTCDLMLPI